MTRIVWLVQLKTSSGEGGALCYGCLPQQAPGVGFRFWFWLTLANYPRKLSFSDPWLQLHYPPQHQPRGGGGREMPSPSPCLPTQGTPWGVGPSIWLKQRPAPQKCPVALNGTPLLRRFWGMYERGSSASSSSKGWLNFGLRKEMTEEENLQT